MKFVDHFDCVRNMLDNVFGHELAVALTCGALLVLCVVSALLIASAIKYFKNARKNLGTGEES